MTGTADLSAAGEGAAGLHEPAGRRVALYQLYFDERSLDRLDPLCIPLSTRAADRYLENRVIADSMASGSLAQCDYLGFFSPRFAEKIPLRMWEILQRCSADGWQQPVYSFFGSVADLRVWRAAEIKHPGISAAARILFDRLDIAEEPQRLSAPVVYQNHFVARAGLVRDYCDQLLVPAMSAMDDPDDTQLQRALNRDAGYRDARYHTAQIIRIFGTPAPSLHPFVCERLFSTWLALAGETVKQIWNGAVIGPAKRYADPEFRGVPGASPGGRAGDSGHSDPRRGANTLVVTTFGQEAWYTQLCLQRIAEWKSASDQLIVVYHDASPLLRIYLEFLRHRGVIDTLLPAVSGHGHLRGVNLGFQHARSDIVFNICIDVLVGPEVVDECSRRLRDNAEIGAIGWHYEWAADYPGSYWLEGRLHARTRPAHKDLPCRDGDALASEYAEAVRAARWYTGRVFEAVGTRRLLCFNGSFFGVRKTLWEQLGGYDERRFSHEWADDHLCYGVLDQGLSVANLNSAYGSGRNPDYFRQYSELKWAGIDDPNRQRNELQWTPWTGAADLTVSELVLTDLLLESRRGGRIALVGDRPLVLPSDLPVQRFATPDQLGGGYQAVILCDAAGWQAALQHLDTDGVLLLMPPCPGVAGVEYHDRLGIVFRTRPDFEFQREE